MNFCRFSALFFAGEGDAADFDAIAAEFSQDTGSRENGGSIGRTKRGNLVRAYEEVAYRMAPGEISQPVRSEFGWHIIKLDDRQGEYIETSHILLKMEPTVSDERLVRQFADSLHTALVDGGDFSQAAYKFTDHKNTREASGNMGWIELDALQPLSRSRVRDLNPGDFTRPLSTELEGKKGVQIIKLISHHDSRLPSLEEDWEQIALMAENFKKQGELESWILEIREKVHIRVVD